MRLPGTKRTVRTPDGTRWRVGRRWTSSWRVDVRRRRVRCDDVLGAGDGGEGGGTDGGGGGGDGGGIGDFFDAEGLAVVALLLVLGIVLLLLFPLLEALIVVLLLVGSVVGRVVFRRPWRVEARVLRGFGRRSVRRAAWQVVGFRRSGAVAKEAAGRLAADGGLPEQPAGTLPLAVPDRPQD